MGKSRLSKCYEIASDIGLVNRLRGQGGPKTDIDRRHLRGDLQVVRKQFLFMQNLGMPVLSKVHGDAAPQIRLRIGFRLWLVLNEDHHWNLYEE